jgi:hypothetical protein
MGRQEMEDATATLDAESASVQDRVKEALRILKEAAKNWNTLELIEVRTLAARHRMSLTVLWLAIVPAG